jgi:hypothetical protein
MQPQRITPAQYARQRGVAKSTVSRQIASGLIPTEADGLIDPVRADRALAKRAVKASGTLAAARYRKAAAAVAILKDEVGRLRARVVPRPEPIAALEVMGREIKARFEAMVVDVAPRVAGEPPAVADGILSAAVDAALTELSEIEVVAEPDKNDPPAPRRPARKLTAVALAARRVELQAERLELRRALANGTLIDLDHQANPVIVDRYLQVRARVLALPSGTAPLFEACSPSQAEKLLRRQVTQDLEALDRPLDFPAWRPWMLTAEPPSLPGNEIDDETMARIEAEREERWLNRAYSICCEIAAEQAGWVSVERRRPPQWRRDWPMDRPAGWVPPPGLLDDMKEHWSSPSCCPFGYYERIAELGLIPPYKPT